MTASSKFPVFAITFGLAVIVWYAFLVGHVINNVRGFGS